MKKKTILPECLLVDGYNIIFSWDELNELAKTNLDHARHRLIDILNNYQGYRKCLLIVVFDAYKIKKNIGSIEKMIIFMLFIQKKRKLQITT